MKEYDPTQEITRKQFFARMRKLGFGKARMELSRNSVTYEREGIRVTLPKGHTQLVMVMGGEFNGWHIPHGTTRLMCSPIPEGWDLLSTVLGFFTGGITREVADEG